jgi:adenine specific DNA methylase Mod
MNSLYFGDNLEVLRESIDDESVDLVYLDPPFNSKRDYNLLFKTPKGHDSDAQITAFEDSWHWGEQAEREFSEILHQSNTDVAKMMEALRQFLGENDMMAYLTMMANRLLELHSVLKPNGSLYLHCDPTASHYLKIVLDGIFGKQNFLNEIIWKKIRTPKAQTIGFGNVHDIIFAYFKGEKPDFNKQFVPLSDERIDEHYSSIEPGTDRRYMLDNFSQMGKGEPRRFGEKIIAPPAGKHWIWSQERIDNGWEEGRIIFTSGGTPRLKRYLDESKGKSVDDLWDDIIPINSQAQERLGYPTQKPLSLLERIINASSNEGDIVLDPFCGCGTAVHAAQKLGRKWIGIDITHLAISLIEKRLRDAFPGINFEVHGTPKDLEGARDLATRDKYQFQWWACSLVNAQPYQGRKKGADSGIDGLIFFQDDRDATKKVVVSVKGGENISVAMVRDLCHVVDREKAQIGLFVTLANPTKPMLSEAAAAGFYESPIGSNFPKIQILTIEALLSGAEQARYPDLTRGGLTFKRAKKETIMVDQKTLF